MKRHLEDIADTAVNEEMETAIREWLRTTAIFQPRRNSYTRATTRPIYQCVRDHEGNVMTIQ